jgi:hypothetical protein
LSDEIVSFPSSIQSCSSATDRLYGEVAAGFPL